MIVISVIKIKVIFKQMPEPQMFKYVYYITNNSFLFIKN